MTEDLDVGLGIILQNLKYLGIDDNTYVIYISDNGSVPNVPGAKKYTYSYNHPLSRGKWDAMEGGIRIPFIVSGPGIGFNKQCNDPVSSCDLLPTIISLAGSEYNIASNIDGGSLKSILLEDENAVIERIVNGIFFHVPYRNKIALNRPHSAIRNGDYKLIKFHDNQQVLLFNMLTDLKEKNDLSKTQPTKKKELETLLDEYLRNVHAPKWKEGITWKNNPINTFNSFH
jgi:arylsulfatase A-like enzyme